jgi:large subunit ribosomal protein L15
MKSKKPQSKKRTRIGRGTGSGKGKTAGRGGKGQTARSGGKIRPGFEGGQNPIYRRLPKRGFNNNYFKIRYQVLNIADLEQLDSKEITPEFLFKQGILKRNLPFKVLGTGTLKKALVVKAHKFSESAKSKIEEAGGRIETLKQS